mmetsp:Transcript_26663/g.40446  ORF Transcript_26663/g.40446 Transcript_26663/m.40446 type:complete len:124 (-) Transcript_26663:355-726(-)
MDDWTLYQLTGDPAYIQSFRRKRALKHAAMGGSFLGLAVVSTGLVMTEVTSNRPGQQSFVPPNLPKKALAATALGCALGAGLSWWKSRDFVGSFIVPSGLKDEELAESPETQPTAAATKKRTF